MVFGIDDALLAAGISGLASVAGGYLSGKSNKPKESKSQKRNRVLIDDLLASLRGKGPYSDLYSANPETFQKSFVEPAKSLFNTQIAPQIQQASIYGGQQRGTGLDDQLLRAGVDLDQLLNQHMMEYQNQAMNRKQNTISNILGQQGGVEPSMSNGSIFGNAVGGYLSSPSFSQTVTDIFNPRYAGSGMQSKNTYQSPPRKGFQPDYKSWNNMPLGDPGWGY